MLSHSTLDDIAYSKYSHSTRTSIKKHHRRRTRQHHKSKRSSNKYNFNHYASDKCAVCLDDATTLDTKLFPCGHTFHGQCLIQWVTIQTGHKFNCPLCRQDIAHFIQMTGNQQINDQLLKLWNQRYLYRTQTTTAPKDATNEPVKCTSTKTVNVATVTKTIQAQTLTQTVSIQPPTETVSSTVINIKKSDCSIWKVLWNSPYSMLYQRKQDSIYTPFTLLNLLHLVYQTNISSIYENKIININDVNNNYFSKFNAQLYGTNSGGKQVTNQLNNTGQITLKMAEFNFNNIQSNKEVPVQTQNDDLLSFTSLNLECGILAGICAGTTTFLNVYKGSFRNSFYPILSETVPNVAIFFTSYEHLKRHVFATDNIKNSYYQTFLERFMSAGIASSVGYFVSGGMNGGGKCRLLPLRLAGFFGTFEFCKDLMNFRHENVGLFGIASSAAIGGTVSHSLYYPLSRYKNRFVLSKMEISGVSLEYVSREMFVRGLFRGWVSSLSKFLPSCVVCSCAFEYSKRYLNNT